MPCYAYYRLPYSDTYTHIESDIDAVVLNDYSEIGREEGFVIAPFVKTESTPLLLIKPERVCSEPVDTLARQYGRGEEDGRMRLTVSEDAGDDDGLASYRTQFDTFHDAIVSGEFRKLVLFRTKRIPADTSRQSLERMFLEACQRYPRVMVMLFSTQQSGTWLIASPEILLEGKGHNYHTIALAGTMPYQEGHVEWSKKNKDEQHIVEQYIENVITPLSEQVVKDGPTTARAGDLQHIRTDFHFRLRDGVTVGDVVGKLHPTPAVCGIPTDKAREFIVSNESQPRLYYSGFAGPVGNDGNHLYVSLRCAEITNETFTLYAGGGIMPDSECESEWKETEAKMNTIKNLWK